LAEGNIAPLTIAHSANLIGHPIGIAILALTGNFLLPKDPAFFLYWVLLVACAAVGSTFAVFALLNTKFFTTQVIGSLGFVTSSVFAVIILGEKFTAGVAVALVVAVAGVILFSWEKSKGEIFKFDRGMVFTILAVVTGGMGAVLYKLASLHTSGYAELYTGRFVTDMFAWTAAWLISLWILGRNPARDLQSLLSKGHGWLLVVGTIVTTSIDTFLIYNLPVTTWAMLGTIIFPVTYLISYFKYRERITLGMWLGTFLIITAIIIYLAAK
jgi:drug/metabolite transporter (DMT)-like permease